MRKYVSFQEQRKEIDALRDTIEGELNRIALTEDPKEVEQMLKYLNHNIQKYAKKNLDAIHGIWNPDVVKSGIPSCVMPEFVKGENKDD